MLTNRRNGESASDLPLSEAPGNGDVLAAWLRLTALGDRRAFRCLYEATAPRLLGQAMAMLRDREVAEDALQDAFVRIWSSASHFDPSRGHALAWMGRIMRNVSIDHFRRTRLAARYHAEEDEVPELAVDPEPVDDRVTLATVMNTLSPEQRDTIERVVIQGWTHEEVAMSEGIPTATAKSRAQRGLRRMRAALDKQLAPV